MKIFALLIGINEYSTTSNPPIRSLNGCVNDVSDFGKFLKENYSDLIPDERQILALTDANASRAKVIAGFREHLAQAGPQDLAVIYYSGHGSTGITAPEFQAATSDSQEQTWVLHDSREPGKYDLADKEIALLLEEVGARSPRIVVIADSCHSGSVTRELEQFLQMQPRFEKGTSDVRPLETYLDGAYVQRGNVNIPSSDHLLLAACDRVERAWENNGHGQFTQSLISVLGKSGGQITYADLFVQVRAFIRNALKNQTPQMEPIGVFNVSQGFLGRNVAGGRLTRYRVYMKAGKWTIDLGAGMGIEQRIGEPVSIQIYDSVAEGRPVGKAVLDVMNVTESTLQTGALSLDANSVYWGEPESLRLQPFFVYGNGAVAQVMQETLAGAAESGVVLTDVPAAALFELRIENGNTAVYHTGSDAAIQIVLGTDKYAATHVLNILQSLARWQRLLDLRNAQSAILPGQITFNVEVEQGGATGVFSDTLITLDHDGEDIPFKVNFRNGTARTVYVSLLYLSPDYGVTIIFNDSQPVPPNTSIVLTSDVFTLNSEEEIDTLKLIVSTEAIDSSLFVQEPLQIGATVAPSGSRGLGQSKGIGGGKSDWITKAVSIRLVKKAERQLGAQEVTIGKGITVRPHDSFRGKLGWAPLVSRTRSVDKPVISEAYAAGNPWFEIVNFDESTRGEDRSIAEVVELSNAAALKEKPLIIDIRPEREDELVLPFFFDGEDFLPMGTLAITAPGVMQVSVDTIPEEAVEKTRSLGGAFRMVFLKFAGKLGIQTDPNRLRWVDYANNAVRESEGLEGKVNQAKSVLLLVHGIIGDTEDMAKTFRMAIDGGYDLVITYDYENLNTPIEEIAAILKGKLNALGFNENDGKELVLVAHSMGGLVSRYMIEELGGDKFVDKLIMAGTPNGGSKFGEIPGYVSWASVALALGTKLFPPQVGAVTGFLSSVLKVGNKQVLHTLAQMDSGSDFIRKLTQKNAAPIPYFIVGGDLDAYLRASNGLPLMEKVVTQIGSWVYKNTVNDIAVSTDSIFQAKTATVPQKVSCHHLNYFVIDESVNALAKLL
ncbi:triacylglycerol esterase/lipase EstA (alpha/beta hydrolase family) [Dyadobacter sp. BE34]|uniref:Triacylglycerol esterase/lipase EstA (Alpha/beta hydrolase family) n=1 Tax=Dyadobacter fermentans TaxID=94254 RepID=A0ABU1R1E8_9BACT|nr:MULTISPECIES: caspase family protein [Dyadobacter]MDR6806739.1 triacylglycerol esterase/lipase EstA (alpha/beta hydrolase family) [Dyadobacter fermentans]MDR7044481.1 triacylglycerol esterase/lipase EstA (alpha/beta hydrolase family) [Dyadobacter sp. BE242]MDR7198791.1 triacylglycerol esterase/lipase EstA (alpha/beta hydrolase family) [Dyadobacter sp. BE34]MDR7216753.1 triacylglycerol esterase/lipase EstA (alpha/beta hydrolase family) [Dyadobacter sp. BE31]MDR7263721.1 triacylglycerol ester